MSKISVYFVENNKTSQQNNEKHLQNKSAAGARIQSTKGISVADI